MQTRILGMGKLNNGFTINNHVCSITVPKGTPVSFQWNDIRKQQEILFVGYPILLFRKGMDATVGKSRWLARAWKKLMLVEFSEPAPYPISFFKRG